jgi:hypothetical protein
MRRLHPSFYPFDRKLAITVTIAVAIGTLIASAGRVRTSAGDRSTKSMTPDGSGRIATPPNVEIRAVYFTGYMAGSEHGKQIATAWRASGGNAVVFDIKDSDGNVTFASAQPLAQPNRHPPIRDLRGWVAWLHEHGLYAIAREAVFKDQRLGAEHPELAVRSRSTGGPWIEQPKKFKTAEWLDPSLEAVQDYNIKLALEAAATGVDEIQFDYLRFPTEGRQSDTSFYFQKHDPTADRADIISDFLYRAHEKLKPTGVHLSIDVFGVDAWARTKDLEAIGQDVVSLSYFCDVICPMIYPSHFFHFDGYEDPGDHPQHFIHNSMLRYREFTADTGVVMRPWLQAFAWHTKTYGPDYIGIQVQTSREQGGNGFMLWNARNDYAAPAKEMQVMMARPGNYFSGGYPYPVLTTYAPPTKPRPTAHTQPTGR